MAQAEPDRERDTAPSHAAMRLRPSTTGRAVALCVALVCVAAGADANPNLLDCGTDAMTRLRVGQGIMSGVAK
eukprot:gene26999-12804_t